MTNGWMLDVLADLRQFADQNDMPGLAAALTRTSVVARDELCAKAASTAEGAPLDERVCGTLPARVVAGQDA